MQNKCFLVVRSEPTDDQMFLQYHQWYEQHIRALLAVKGVQQARRFESIDGDMRYMAMYEIDDFNVFSSPEYRAVGRFGAMEPHVRFTRNVYREIPIYGFAKTIGSAGSSQEVKK
jgi:hypothetical protein